LVVVANIQVESDRLKADVGEGFHVNSNWTWVSPS